MCMYVNLCGISLAMQCIKDSCQSKQTDVSDAPYEFSACISHYNSASVLILRLYLRVPGITSSECVCYGSVLNLSISPLDERVIPLISSNMYHV